MGKLIICFLLIGSTFLACKKEDVNTDKVLLETQPTPYTLFIPDGLPVMIFPNNNPLTIEGIALGKKLFYDPILSGDNSISCGSCHKQNFAFADSSLQYSIGINNLVGTRNAMPLFNLGYQGKFFWDGGAATLESQVIAPIENPLEMHENLTNAVNELNAIDEYKLLFKNAFNIEVIEIAYVMRAIAQFERTMISGNSKYDKYQRGEEGIEMSDQELNGMQLYVDMEKGDCNHCHVLGSTFSDFVFRSTGLDSIPVDKGRGLITLNTFDDGKFKTPSLRNIELTAPYMHDGRFVTLEEVMDHYNTNFHYTTNLDPNLANSQKGRMNEQEMQDIIAFLKTLTDYEFINNENFKNN
jgi:cytochrome c peroxidase